MNKNSELDVIDLVEILNKQQNRFSGEYLIF